jgi:hypothetical protein
VLAPRGHALYLYEPSCRPYLYSVAKWRVNRKRPEVPEDILVHDKIVAIARHVGLDCELDYYPSTRRREPLETLYYAVLKWATPLQRMLPVTINYHFHKPQLAR